MIEDVYLINTSHVDITWWDTPENCRKRIIETIDEAIRLCDECDGFRFSIESVYPIYMYLRERPAQRDALIACIESGMMDTGGLYISPVSDYSFDEALYRNFQFGKQWLLENTGIDTTIAKEEDSPGHTLQFPQLCAGFGMKYARFSRGPLRLFRWKAPDGSEVLTYTAGYSWGFYERMGGTFGEKWRKGIPKRLHYAEKNDYSHKALMLPDGDDNALPNPDGPRLAAAWNKHRGKPRFIMSTMLDFFERANRFNVKTYSGDIPNTWAQISIFQPDAFSAVRRLRRILPLAELCLSLNNASGNEPVKTNIDSVWRTLLECLDHNWGGRFQGSYGLEGDLLKLGRLNAALDAAQNILNDAVPRLSGNSSPAQDAICVLVFNTLSCMSSAPVEIEIDTELHPELNESDIEITDENGIPCPAQEINNVTPGGLRSIIFHAEDVPPFGYKTFHLRKSKNDFAKTKSAGTDAPVIENKFYRIRMNSNGACIRSIIDKETGRDILPDPSGRLLDLFGITLGFNEIWALGFRFDPAPEGFYEDPKNEGKVGESTYLTGKIVTASECATRRLPGDSGSVFSSMKSETKFVEGSAVEQEIILYEHTKRIDLKTRINWTGAEDLIVSIALPFGPDDGRMTMDVPYGVHRFGEEVPGFWGKTGGASPMLKALGQYLPRSSKKWLRSNFFEEKNAALGSLKRTLTGMMMNEGTSLSRGLYNWLDISNSEWGATLMTPHAPFDFTFGPCAFLFASVKSSAFFNGGHYLRRGSHEFTFSLTSHKGGWRTAGIHQSGRAANSPLTAFTISGGALPTSGSLLESDNCGIIFTAVKPGGAPGEIIARFYESLGERKTTRIRSMFKIKKAVLCDMMEKEIVELPLRDDAVEIQTEPFKIYNVKLVLERD